MRIEEYRFVVRYRGYRLKRFMFKMVVFRLYVGICAENHYGSHYTWSNVVVMD